MNLDIGHTYLVNHSRKGTFAAKLIRQDDEWAVLEVVAGKAKAMLSYNEVEKGEVVTVRKSFCTFTAQPVGAAA